MSKKIDRALYGPSWTEVFFGALLSVVLGVVLAAAYLLTKPVATVKEPPKEAVSGVVYYIEGTRDATKGRQWKAKHQQFLAGASVTLTEDELNTAVAALAEPPANPAAGAAAPTGTKVAAGVPNFRIRNGELQIGVPLAINAFSLAMDVVVQARGGFEKRGGRFVYAPSTLLVGSLPVQRIPVLSGYVLDKFYAQQAVPEDISTAWGRLDNVSIDGAQLKLDAP